MSIGQTNLKNVRAQIRRSLGGYIFVASMSSLLLGLVLILRIWVGVPFSNLTGDLAARADLPTYTGFLSQFGLFFWAATVAVITFSVRLLVWQSGFAGNKEVYFLVGGFIITIALGLDDAFMLHEDTLVNLGIPEKVTYVSYGVLILVWVGLFWRIIFSTDYLLLMMALLFFGVSMKLDLAELRAFFGYFVEDGAKIVGILAWLAYFYRVGWRFTQLSFQKGGGGSGS